MLAALRLRQIAALPRAQRALLVRALVWLAAADIGLRIFGFKRLIDRAPTVRGTSTPREHERATALARYYAGSLDLAARHHVVRAHCLQRSLVLHYWLRRDHLPSELRIGVRKDDGDLRAHAWVELDGEVVNDAPRAVAAFTPLVGSIDWVHGR